MRFDDDRPKTSSDDSDEFSTFDDRPAARPWLFATSGAALFGAFFAGVSTSDFVEHLDRQVHSIHCSFLPGAGAQLGESGCRTVMMSAYSSIFRSAMWGGLPISLLALAVFSYLVYRALDFALKPKTTARETMFLVVATLLPVGMSLIYATISFAKLDALCKLCAGVYASSAASLIFALVAHNKADPEPPHLQKSGLWTRWFLEGVAYVGILVVGYLVFAPKSPKTVEGCGALVRGDDPSGIVIPLEGSAAGAPSIAVLDPLCPACKAFDQRLDASGLTQELNIRAVLFPLDATCNWMLKRSLHPGACAVSEAMLCDKEDARRILAYAFAHQEELRSSAEKSDAPVRDRLLAEFPKLKSCLGSSVAKNKVNKSLRWAVANALPVLTPQLFVGDRRVCDEDTDLGLEYTIRTMLDHRLTKKAAK
jgi:uncharacterized membrane protein